jgi:hypothetical protein
MPPGRTNCMKCDTPWAYRLTRIQDGKVEDAYLCLAHASQANSTVKRIRLGRQQAAGEKKDAQTSDGS